jgi:bacterioferritin (cytochrome b1)
MGMKEQQQVLVEKMKQWQKLETQAVSQTAKIMESTEHPLIRMIAEVIQRDSQNHHRVQQLIIDSYEKEKVPLLQDQVADVWDAIEEHIRIEKKTIEMAKASLGALEGTREVLQRYLLNYLLTDEEKHDKLLADLDLIKRQMYP